MSVAGSQDAPVDSSLEQENTARDSSLATTITTAGEKGPKPITTPFTEPAASVEPEPRPSTLNPEQQSKYEDLLNIVKGWTKIPSSTGKEGGITDDEIMWLTRDCLLRYLRATKWNTAEAAKRVLGTLTWRRDYDLSSLTPEHISPENETGKQIIFGYDVKGRACLYLNPGRQNTSPSPRQVQHLVFMVERTINLMIPEQETLALLINFKSSKNRSNTSPPLSQGREVLNILQTHYPERLGRACIINVPWVVSGFFKLITPFIDPLTREKLKFNEDVRTYVPAEQLWNEFGGDVDFEYDHGIYWPALNKMCQERNDMQRARWEKGGKIYGESEIYLKGGNVVVGTESGKTVNSPSPKESSNPQNAPTETAIQSAPLPTTGAQANGNTDVAAILPDPKLTTEGDRT